MEVAETLHPDYQKGFNEGYIIKKYMPELASKLVEPVTGSLRGIGFNDGCKQFEAEKDYERYPSWLREDRLINLDNEPDASKERDKDNIEPDLEGN